MRELSKDIYKNLKEQHGKQCYLKNKTLKANKPFPTDNFMKYKMKINPNKIILEILWHKMKTKDLKWC